jgi:hypothetical protein
MLRIISPVRIPILLSHLTQAPRPSPVRFATISKSVLRRQKRRRIDLDSPKEPLELFAEMSTQHPHAPRGSRKKGLPKDSPAVRDSKTLAWILRHGAKAEGIAMRPDGYVLVADLVGLS